MLLAHELHKLGEPSRSLPPSTMSACLAATSARASDHDR
jgi:hypothetical protein